MYLFIIVDCTFILDYYSKVMYYSKLNYLFFALDVFLTIILC